MPSRIIREAILSSERVALLGWPEEVFYRRLLSIVDDYGRYEANHQLLRSRCYPLQVDDVRVADISRWMAACQKAGLILVFAVHGKQYLEVCDFGQQKRTDSKYPDPKDADSSCDHLPANVHLGVSVFGVVSGVVSSSPRGDALFDEFWKAYPNKVGKDAAHKAFDKRKVTRELLDLMLKAVEEQKRLPQWMAENGKFIPHPSTWLNEGRWMDEGATVQSAPVKGRDPELRRIEEDRAKAVPIPENIREQLKALRGNGVRV